MDNPKVVRFHARVNGDYVDICGTLEANLSGKLLYNETEETGVHFYEHAPIHVYDVEVLGMDPYDPNVSIWNDSSLIETVEIEAMRKC